MTQGSRTDRVAEEFREVLAEEIPRLKDPRVGFVTVTGVRVSRDLRQARVFYTAFGDDRERAATRAGLRSAASHLRSAIGTQMRLKFLPELRFEEDPSIAQGERIEDLIRRAHRDEADDG
jgi:ribosome-binding factor A